MKTGLEPRSVREALEWGRRALSEAGIEESRRESEWLLSSLSSLKSAALHVDGDKPLETASLKRFEQAIALRAQRTPFAYVLGFQEFMGLDFRVDENVLVPRPETEILVAEALKKLARTELPKVLDIGTGSGNIPVSLAHYGRGLKAVATDISPKALDVARENARHHQEQASIQFFQSDLLEALSPQSLWLEYFDMIVSNPPYVRSEELERLEPEVRLEPREALDGGPDGLEIYRRLIPDALPFLKKGGWMMLEIGYDQSDAVLKLMEQADLNELGLMKDYSGIERIALGRRKEL